MHKILSISRLFIRFVFDIYAQVDDGKWANEGDFWYKSTNA